ncbi:MAG: endonuclease/exonuclease/phosphatase family protein [Burkholderiales bacterium]
MSLRRRRPERSEAPAVGRRRSPASAVLAAIVAAAVLAACVTISEEPRAIVAGAAGVRAATLDCASALADARAAPPAAAGVDPAAVRVLTWNLHKEGDDGWQDDLARFAAANDALLLQEVVLEDALQAILRDSGFAWVMASSFVYQSANIGVLTATRVPPLASCTQRFAEPLIAIPKSTVITWLPVAGVRTTLAVANVHAVNFSLSLDAYEAQLDALAAVLATHDGPLVVGGDLNTWSQERRAAVRRFADRLGLAEIAYADDGRSRFLGQQVDHLLVRGLAVVTSTATAVRSSDHNPVSATFRVSASAGPAPR